MRPPNWHGTRAENQPQADFTIRRGKDGWYVHFGMKTYGPHPKTKAIAAAIKTARLAEKAGKAARVREEYALAHFRTHWPPPRGHADR